MALLYLEDDLRPSKLSWPVSFLQARHTAEEFYNISKRPISYKYLMCFVELMDNRKCVSRTGIGEQKREKDKQTGVS